MWDLPGPGLEPVSPALAGGFLTTAPPGKSKNWKNSAFQMKVDKASTPSSPLGKAIITGFPCIHDIHSFHKHLPDTCQVREAGPGLKLAASFAPSLRTQWREPSLQPAGRAQGGAFTARAPRCTRRRRRQRHSRQPQFLTVNGTGQGRE